MHLNEGEEAWGGCPVKQESHYILCSSHLEIPLIRLPAKPFCNSCEKYSYCFFDQNYYTNHYYTGL